MLSSFPEWFAGFCFAAIALGALVPAAIMSIGAANLVTRNIWRPYVNSDMSARQETTVAKIASLVVKVGALVFVVFLPREFAINLQLVGGIWMLQAFPAVVLGLFTRWLRADALLSGWAIGMALGTGLCWIAGAKPVFPVPGLGAVYIGLIALAANLACAVLLTWIADRRGLPHKADATVQSDYEDAVVG